MLRAQLMSQLRDIARSMTPRKAARRFGVSPWRLNHLLSGRIGRLNIDALVSMLRHAGIARRAYRQKDAVIRKSAPTHMQN
jgi:predicted XRE-type DNA-binding protein